jgi:hypothetical protein
MPLPDDAESLKAMVLAMAAKLASAEDLEAELASLRAAVYQFSTCLIFLNKDRCSKIITTQ